MTYSIAHYKAMYNKHLDELKESKDEIGRKHLLCIKELMLFYKKLGERTFLGKKSSINHVSKANEIIKIIEDTLSTKYIYSNVYESALKNINYWIVMAYTSTSKDFNKKGDFANIHEALKECTLDYDFYKKTSYALHVNNTAKKKEAPTSVPTTPAPKRSGTSPDSYNNRMFAAVLAATEITYADHESHNHDSHDSYDHGF